MTVPANRTRRSSPLDLTESSITGTEKSVKGVSDCRVAAIAWGVLPPAKLHGLSEQINAD
ncbi:MAG: hypothetical protein LBL31_02235 [Spirochaetaceae bacterium]|nr:hypothetical protein [Spirochaetaceae bacterium]